VSKIQADYEKITAALETVIGTIDTRVMAAALLRAAQEQCVIVMRAKLWTPQQVIDMFEFILTDTVVAGSDEKAEPVKEVWVEMGKKVTQQ
jgi:hypothetical protein